MLRRVLVIGGGLLAVWLVLLVVLGIALGSRQERHTRERLAESMQAQVSIGAVDLALVRGRLSIATLAIKRDDLIGHMTIDVERVRCELAPLGLALLDRDCRDLVIHGLHLEVSTAALFKMQRPPRSRPVRADRVVIENATLVFSPSAFIPNLGRIEIAIEHAEAGPTVMRTPLSWLFSLVELRARFDLPAGISVRLGYKNGLMTATGSVFGSGPIDLPLQIPVATSAKDAHDEMLLLVQLGKQIAERLVAKRAEDWLRAKLMP
jgi:hypothetical protein